MGAVKFAWDNWCNKAFNKLKAYLCSPPLLVSLGMTEETLFMYLVTLDETLTVVLIKEMPGGQFPVYYIRKALHTSKLNYRKIEKMAYTLLMASRKLR